MSAATIEVPRKKSRHTESTTPKWASWRTAPSYSTCSHHATVVDQQGPNHCSWRPSACWRHLCLQEFTCWQESLSTPEPTGEWTWRVCRLLCVCPSKPCWHSFSKLRPVPRPTPPAGRGQGGKGTGITALPSKFKPSVCHKWFDLSTM